MSRRHAAVVEALATCAERTLMHPPTKVELREWAVDVLSELDELDADARRTLTAGGLTDGQVEAALTRIHDGDYTQCGAPTAAGADLAFRLAWRPS